MQGDIGLLSDFGHNLIFKQASYPIKKGVEHMSVLARIILLFFAHSAFASDTIPQEIDLYKLGQRIYAVGTDSWRTAGRKKENTIRWDTTGCSTVAREDHHSG